MTERLPPAIFLMGPTASGKTDLALALADALPCELISVDSALIYRGMDIGTAKPDKATLARYPHRPVDIRDPAESYSAAEFRADALVAMALRDRRVFNSHVDRLEAASVIEDAIAELQTNEDTFAELERAGDRDYVTFVAERKVIETARAFFAVKSGEPILSRIVALESAVRDLNATDSTKKLEELKPRSMRFDNPSDDRNVVDVAEKLEIKPSHDVTITLPVHVSDIILRAEGGILTWEWAFSRPKS